MSNTIIDLSVDDDAEESPAWATPLRSPARTKREPPSLCPTSCTISLDSDEETEVSASGWSGSGREAAEMADIGSAWKRRHVECDSGGCSAPDCLQEDIKLYDTTSGAAGIQRAQTEFKPFAHPALGAPPPPRSMTAPPPPPPNPFFDQEDSKTPAELLRLILGEDGDDVDLANAASVERVDHATAATEAGFTYNSELDVFQLNSRFSLSSGLFKRAFPYQRHAIKWMWDLFNRKDEILGGVLGDDMGLGKTFQVCAFLSGLMKGQAAHTALIVVPVSLIPTWEAEIGRCMGTRRRVTVHGTLTGKRAGDLDAVLRLGGLCVTTYGSLISQQSALTVRRWDVLVLDEATVVKNPETRVARTAVDVPSKMRLLLTGTPLQNKLGELWSLFNIACHGKLLGSQPEFHASFGSIILKAQDSKAPEHVKLAGDEAMGRLRDKIHPFFLRREKGAPHSAHTQGRLKPYSEAAPKNIGSVSAHKVEVVVWAQLTPIQLTLYKGFLQSDDVKAVLNKDNAALASLCVLKKICCHPLLLSDRARAATSAARRALVANDKSITSAQYADVMAAMEGGEAALLESLTPTAKTVEALTKMSGKLQFLIKLLDIFEEQGNRALVFSQSKVELDIIQCLLIFHRVRYERIDGSIKSTDDRQATVNRFNTTPDIRVCLLTTGVGAYGLTLTGADRVVIMDPSWNPAVDAQAVDRAYRLGQTKDVVTYRFITCGTIEEKMYRLQVFKGGLTRSVLSAKCRKRYLTRSQLCAMFTLGDTIVPETRAMLLESLKEDVFISDASGCVDVPPEISVHLEELIFSFDNIHISQHDRLFKLAESLQDRNPFALKQFDMAAQGSVPAAPLEPVVKGEQPLTVSACAAGGPAAVACKFEAKSDAGVKMDRSVSVEELPDWGLYDYDGDDEIFGDIAGAPLLALTASGAPMTSLHSLKPDRDVDIVILDSDDEDDAFLFPTVKPEHRLEDTAARFAATAGLAVKPEFKFKP